MARQTMKAVLIDAARREVRDVEYDGDYKSIYRLIGCECFTVVGGLPDGDDLFVDDEGLLRMTADTTFIRIPWYPTPLAGSGLVLGHNRRNGESKSANHDAEFYRQHVRFESAAAVRLREELMPTGWPTMTVYAFDTKAPNTNNEE